MTDPEEKNIWENLYAELQCLLAPYEGSRVAKNVAAEAFLWETAENQLILKGDAAAELGGGNQPAVSGVLYLPDRGEYADPASGIDSERDKASAVAEGERGETRLGVKGVTLYGADLPDLKGNVPYARVTIVRLKPEFMTEEFKLYNLLRSIEYIRYHVNPLGYMPRISTAQNREQVRVSAGAVQKGLDLYKAGRIYGEAYLRHPAVVAVEMIFITLSDFDYKALERLFERAEQWIMSLDHPLNNLKMDCDSCNLKEVCDEVEKLCDTDRRERGGETL